MQKTQRNIVASDKVKGIGPLRPMFLFRVRSEMFSGVEDIRNQLSPSNEATFSADTASTDSVDGVLLHVILLYGFN